MGLFAVSSRLGAAVDPARPAAPVPRGGCRLRRGCVIARIPLPAAMTGWSSVGSVIGRGRRVLQCRRSSARLRRVLGLGLGLASLGVGRLCEGGFGASSGRCCRVGLDRRMPPRPRGPARPLPPLAQSSPPKPCRFRLGQIGPRLARISAMPGNRSTGGIAAKPAGSNPFALANCAASPSVSCATTAP